MIIETINFNLPNGQNLKITFRKESTVQGNFLMVNIVDMNLNCFRKLTPHEKYFYYGVQIYKERINTKNYPNYEDLKKDILCRYDVDIFNI